MEVAQKDGGFTACYNQNNCNQEEETKHVVQLMGPGTTQSYFNRLYTMLCVIGFKPWKVRKVKCFFEKVVGIKPSLVYLFNGSEVDCGYVVVLS